MDLREPGIEVHGHNPSMCLKSQPSRRVRLKNHEFEGNLGHKASLYSPYPVDLRASIGLKCLIKKAVDTIQWYSFAFWMVSSILEHISVYLTSNMFIEIGEEAWTSPKALVASNVLLEWDFFVTIESVFLVLSQVFWNSAFKYLVIDILWNLTFGNYGVV